MRRKWKGLVRQVQNKQHNNKEKKTPTIFSLTSLVFAVFPCSVLQSTQKGKLKRRRRALPSRWLIALRVDRVLLRVLGGVEESKLRQRKQMVILHAIARPQMHQRKKKKKRKRKRNTKLGVTGMSNDTALC